MVAEFTGEIRWVHSIKIYTLLALTNEVKTDQGSTGPKGEAGGLAGERWLAL